MILYQRKKTGKIKFLELSVQGNGVLISKWGELGSEKIQETKKQCQETNYGKTNYNNALAQAKLELQAKITKKKNEGYVESLDEINETSVVAIDLENLPREFCPTKPISKPPAKILSDPNTYGQRKRDGHCIILVKTISGREIVYSRGVEDITEFMLPLPPVSSFLSSLEDGSMVFTEFCFKLNKNDKDSTREVAKLVRKKDSAEVLRRYQEATHGVFEVVPFDIMFDEGSFVGHWSYRERYNTMKSFDSFTNLPEIIEDWSSCTEQAKKDGWEGFILRNDNLGKGSAVHYSLNGKADRAGCYKYVFTHNDDFVVTRAEKGKSGKHSGMYSQFFIGQYNDSGEFLEMGKTGPGKMTHQDLADLTKDIEEGVTVFPFVIQVEFRGQEPDSGKLSFPVFEKTRFDKNPKECITDFVPE